jgi:hypothetical protein
MSKNKCKNWKRSGRIVRHHIKNRCHGGKSTPSNLLKFDSERERAFHFVFGNKSFEEVAELLLRTCRSKGRK